MCVCVVVSDCMSIDMYMRICTHCRRELRVSVGPDMLVESRECMRICVCLEMMMMMKHVTHVREQRIVFDE